MLFISKITSIVRIDKLVKGWVPRRKTAIFTV